jgi:hypothetical protein
MAKHSKGEFARYIGSLLAHEKRAKVAAQLQREGVDLKRVFVALRVYAEGRSIATERRSRGKQTSNIINEGVRKHGLAPEVGGWLRNRAKLAYAIDGLSRTHCVDSLGFAVIYMQERTKRRITMSELAYLLDATNWALGRQPEFSDPKNLQHELARWRKNNPRFVKILTADIKSKL